MITLHQFPGPKNFPNLSPFCAKLETYFRMAQVEYNVKSHSRIGQGPKKKMPYIEIDGKAMGDSHFIIEHLESKMKKDLDSHLSKTEKATSTAFIALMEDHLVPAMVYFRWVDPEGSSKFIPLVLARAPFPVRKLLPPLIRKSFRKRLWAMGIGRHSREEILLLIEKDLAALNDFIAGKKYFMGSEISKVDCTAFGVLGNLVYEPTKNSASQLIGKFPELIHYVERMKARYYPELTT